MFYKKYEKFQDMRMIELDPNGEKYLLSSILFYNCLEDRQNEIKLCKSEFENFI